MTPSEARWLAVQERDSRSDGKFVYAVTTTGVYCRPACPSRLALRTNIRFFDTCEEAASAGFRACKRCKPDGTTPAASRREALERSRRMLDQSVSAVPLADLAREAGLSVFHFHRQFREAFGVTPAEYSNQLRTRRARLELRTADSITSAIYQSGFNSSGRFYEKLPASLGMTPGAYRKAGKGLTLDFAVTRCSLGLVLAATTERGLCWVAVGDDESSLRHNLREEFPAAIIRPAGNELDESMRTIVNLIEQSQITADLPLDPNGTAFQHKVWSALGAIKRGSTTTYSALAEALGQPGAARAVARACATNPLAVVVPCHRVVRSDGGLSGYRWGPERKKALLERERDQPTKR